MSGPLDRLNLPDIQKGLAAQGASAWLIYDFRGLNPVFGEIFGNRQVSRRIFLVIPATGAPSLIANAVDADKFRDIARSVYRNVDEMLALLKTATGPNARVVMEYSPGGGLPIVSYLDAGTFELLRANGFDILSSADIHQKALALWSPEDLAHHKLAADIHGRAIQEAFDLIGSRLGTITEGDVIDFLTQRLSAQGIEIAVPSVGANANSGMPHYELNGARGNLIRKGDWVMIDAHAHVPGQVFADITWVGYAGSKPPAQHQRVFDTVVAARDLAVEVLFDAYRAGRRIEGWELDRVARDHVTACGFGAYFTHRLGHSLGRGIHGRGANLDDLESHDTRALIPHTAFTIEPGIYLPEFGARSEINIHISDDGPVITTPVQTRIRTI